MIWFLEGRRRALGDKAWGFLDGANQGTLGICGTGAVFFINNHHSFTFKYGVGMELIAELNSLNYGF